MRSPDPRWESSATWPTPNALCCSSRTIVWFSIPTGSPRPWTARGTFTGSSASARSSALAPPAQPLSAGRFSLTSSGSSAANPKPTTCACSALGVRVTEAAFPDRLPQRTFEARAPCTVCFPSSDLSLGYFSFASFKPSRSRQRPRTDFSEAAEPSTPSRDVSSRSPIVRSLSSISAFSRASLARSIEMSISA